MSANDLQRRLALLGTLVLKLYVNAIQSPVHYYQIIKKTSLSPSGIEPATDVLCHNISVALPTLLPNSFLSIPNLAYVIEEYAISYSFMFYTCLMTGYD